MTPSFTTNHAPVSSAVKSVRRRHSRGSVVAGWVDSWPDVSAGSDVGVAGGVDGSSVAPAEAEVSVRATSATIAVAPRTRRIHAHGETVIGERSDMETSAWLDRPANDTADARFGPRRPLL